MPADPADLSAFTLRCYGQLTQQFRDADAEIDGRPLLTYLACQLEQLASVDELLDRFSYIPEDESRLTGRRTSDLIDPAGADEAWLPWQALVYGATIDLTADLATKRLEVAQAESWWARGSRSSIVTAAQTALDGSRHCVVIPNHGGDPWTIEIQVIAAEIIAGGDASVIAAVDAADCRPAGHGLVVTHYVSTWDTQEARFPTWADRETPPAGGSWDAIETVV